MPNVRSEDGKAKKAARRRQRAADERFAASLVYLGEKEFQRGLAFVACSRVCSIDGLAFDAPFPASRLTNLGGGGSSASWEEDVKRREDLGFKEEFHGQ
ncbi:hypothetical protein BCR35DRAFT_301284 [Leucosporidium creatinivorum]|uniref:Uncharacterized protein n=1 Tax=Leucosporidium creatinivorum TaxID=106004 RepID=A0A1Y2G0T8_9BASI|nr:hypothetical protein BCR35DRAFT_301284 [Leucosporidium creatinivorum]